mgnify:CR=1 FL=1
MQGIDHESSLFGMVICFCKMVKVGLGTKADLVQGTRPIIKPVSAMWPPLMASFGVRIF